jgi:hypothetical protein
MDFVPKKSRVACVLQCGGIWIGGKGWGITWKLTQCVVKPPEIVSVFGTCHIPDDICNSIDKQDKSPQEEDDEDTSVTEPVVTSTTVEDSDDETTEDAPAPLEVKPVKKVVKKAAPVAEPVVETAAVAAEEQPKKKIVKKKI